MGSISRVFCAAESSKSDIKARRARKESSSSPSRAKFKEVCSRFRGLHFMAEGVGFEPTVTFLPRSISSRVPSTGLSHPSLFYLSGSADFCHLCETRPTARSLPSQKERRKRSHRSGSKASYRNCCILAIENFSHQRVAAANYGALGTRVGGLARHAGMHSRAAAAMC